MQPFSTMIASLPSGISRSRQLWMWLFVAALIVLPTIARTYQTIIKSQTARLGYRSAWVGVTARRAVTSPREAAATPPAPIAMRVEVSPIVPALPPIPVDEIVPSSTQHRTFDILRGPPSVFPA